MKHILILTAGFCLLGFAAPAKAQSSDYENALLGQSMEARVGVTIPFGGDGKSNKSKPKLALIGRRTQSNRASVDWAMKPGLSQNDFTETRLALTLSAQPELLLNGQEIYAFGDERDNLSDDVKTAGKVALGAGVIVVTVIAAAFGLYAIAVFTGNGPSDDG